MVISQLGSPIPNTPHAVSVCLPLWQDNVDYEEGLDRVHGVLRSGYPRFVYHHAVRKLFALCLLQLGREGEDCIVFPSARVARECCEFVVNNANQNVNEIHGGHNDHGVRLDAIRLNGVDLSVVLFPKILAKTAKHFWQHSGEIPSSRLAEFACRRGQPLSESEELDEYVEEHYGRNMSWSSASAARNALRRRISDASGEAKQNVFLFPCGMSAVYNAHRFLRALSPNLKGVQFGFDDTVFFLSLSFIISQPNFLFSYFLLGSLILIHCSLFRNSGLEVTSLGLEMRRISSNLRSFFSEKRFWDCFVSFPQTHCSSV
jgi:cystathionine gamma-synthase